MSTIPVYEQLSDADLRAAVSRAVAAERESTAIVIGLLSEVERRRLYLEDGYPSLYVYCIDCHHFSESEAFNRMQAARLALKWPQTLAALQRGEITLTSLTILKPHFTDENCDGLLAEARHQPTRVVERIAARLAPRPDAPARMRPLAPGKYKLEVTIDEETHDLILAARNLLLSTIPNGDLAAVTKIVYREAVARRLKRRSGATGHPKSGRTLTEGSRTIPAAVKREVWERDGGRCAFEGIHGRCPVSGAVDYHHLIPYAMGGEPTVENIELRCRAHNLFEARRDGLEWPKNKSA